MSRPTTIAAACPHMSDAVRRLNPQLGAQAVSTPASRPRLKQDRKGLNKWETEFLEYLREIRAGYEIKREGLGIRLGNGCVYWPDFTVGTARTEIWEVKGRRLSTGIAKLKIAASLWPTFCFFLATKRRKRDGGGWEIQEVLA